MQGSLPVLYWDMPKSPCLIGLWDLRFECDGLMEMKGERQMVVCEKWWWRYMIWGEWNCNGRPGEREWEVSGEPSIQQSTQLQHFSQNCFPISAATQSLLPISTDLCYTSRMPSKRKPSTPSSRRRTPKRGRKAVVSQDIHYPGGGLSTTFLMNPVEGLS